MSGTTFALTNPDIDTILAALRYYQSKGMGISGNRSPDIDAIATNMDSHSGLDEKDIDDLCERINCGQ